MKAISTILERPRVYGLGATLVLATATAACAQIAVRLPFTPVPITFQVFAVVLSGLLLGSRLGALAQLEYLAVGLAGAPVFAHFTGGPLAFFGPSGGYLPGFVAGAFITGLIFEKSAKPDIYRAFAAGMAGVATLYLFGVAWLAVWLRFAPAPFAFSAWLLGVAPFIGIDAVKVTLAAMIATGSKWRK